MHQKSITIFDEMDRYNQKPFVDVIFLQSYLYGDTSIISEAQKKPSSVFRFNRA